MHAIHNYLRHLPEGKHSRKIQLVARSLDRFHQDIAIAEQRYVSAVRLAEEHGVVAKFSQDDVEAARIADALERRIIL